MGRLCLLESYSWNSTAANFRMAGSIGKADSRAAITQELGLTLRCQPWQHFVRLVDCAKGCGQSPPLIRRDKGGRAAWPELSLCRGTLVHGRAFSASAAHVTTVMLALDSPASSHVGKLPIHSAAKIYSGPGMRPLPASQGEMRPERAMLQLHQSMPLNFAVAFRALVVNASGAIQPSAPLPILRHQHKEILTDEPPGQCSLYAEYPGDDATTSRIFGTAWAVVRSCFCNTAGLIARR